MARGGRPSPRRALLLCPLLLGATSSFGPSAAAHRRRHRHGPSSSPAPPFSLLLAAGAAGIPASSKDRDESAISSVRSALSRPRVASYPLIECEFPSLSSLNKLGDGSLRSSLEAEDANLDFVARLVDGISSPVPWLFGPRASVVISSYASDSLVEKVRRRMGNNERVAVYSLKGGGGGGIPDSTKAKGGGGDVLVFMTPSSREDYRVARSLAESGRPVVIVNGSFKDLKTIPGSATMAYYVKPLTYNSQVAGYLIRAYPSPWTVLDARSKAILGSFDDGEMLVDGTNTPDLRGSGRLVQRSVDEWAIRARSRG